MLRGNAAIRAWRKLADSKDKSMHVGQEWDKGHPIGYAIWFYNKGQSSTLTVMTRASDIDSLRGPESQ